MFVILKKKLTFPHCDFKLKPLLDGLLKKDTKLRISSIDKIKELDCMGDFPFDDVLTGKTKAPFIPKTREIDVEYNIETEHEKMFSNEGIPIKYCIALYK